MPSRPVVVVKTWRSEMGRLDLFAILSVVSWYLSTTFPSSVIEGRILSIGDTNLMLALPLFWFLPAFAAASAIYRVYNVRYVIDSRGIEARVGILSTHQRITRVRFEDIRSVETEQTLMQRLLDIGDVEIGTAATGEIEILFDGVPTPTEVQDMIQTERDRRHKLQKQQTIVRQEAASA